MSNQKKNPFVSSERSEVPMSCLNDDGCPKKKGLFQIQPSGFRHLKRTTGGKHRTSIIPMANRLWKTGRISIETDPNALCKGGSPSAVQVSI